MSITFTDRSKLALSLAVDLHKNQNRKIAEGESSSLASPYLGHLLNVASYVLQSGGSEDQFIAALLHDAVEDQNYTLERTAIQIIRDTFGSSVLDLVLAATDGEIDEERSSATWRKRKEHHLEKLKDTVKENPAGLLVPLADKLDNLTSTVRDLKLHGPIVWKRFNAKPEDIIWYYDALSKVFTKAFTRNHFLITIYLEQLKNLKRIANSSYEINVVEICALPDLYPLEKKKEPNISS